MSADKIRKLAEDVGKHRRVGFPTAPMDDTVVTALLAYADMVERCDELRFNMIPHKHDTEIVDYILRGDAGKDER